MNEWNLPLALLDIVPVLLFFFGCIELMKAFWTKMTQAQYTMFASGSTMIFLAGMLNFSASGCSGDRNQTAVYHPDVYGNNGILRNADDSQFQAESQADGTVLHRCVCVQYDTGISGDEV